MNEWCMQHPWMTFFIVVLLLLVIDSIVDNLCGRDED
jgi:hypothetical protein